MTAPPVWQQVLGMVEPVEPSPKREAPRKVERPSAWEETVQPAYYCYANLTIKTRITV